MQAYFLDFNLDLRQAKMLLGSVCDQEKMCFIMFKIKTKFT